MTEWKEVTGEFGKSVRWTEEPQREWEKENTIWTEGEVHGVLENIRKGVGENEATIYEIFTANYGPVSVWDTTVLADKMKKVMVGCEVKISFEGEVKPKTGGKAYKQFKVLYREDVDPELQKAIDGFKTFGGEMDK